MGGELVDSSQNSVVSREKLEVKSKKSCTISNTGIQK